MQAPVPGVIAVVRKDGHALLVRRGKAPGKGLWGFPGGHLEWGETALQGAAREVLEETALVVRPQGYITCVDAILRDTDGAVRNHYLLAAVRCAYVSGQPVAGDDADAAEWVRDADILTGAHAMVEGVADLLTLARAQDTKRA